MPSKRPTLILVHGAWHSTLSLQPLVGPLEAAGYRCITPPLLSCGELADFITKEDDALIVQNVVEKVLEQGEDIVMIGHSLGSRVSCIAVETSLGEKATKRKGKVLGLLMIAGFIPPVYVKGAFAEVEPIDLAWCAFDPTKDTSHLPLWPKHSFYNDLTEEQAEYWASQLRRNHVPTAAPSFEAWRYIPTCYLACTKDQTLEIGFQEAMIKAAKSEGGIVNVTYLDTGHCPMLSQPGNVVDWIKKAVEEELVK